MEKFSLILLSGKAEAGKTTVANMMRDIYNSKGEKAIPTSFAKYIKMYAKDVTTWDGEESTKPREILQALGNLIRDYLGKEDLLLDRLYEDIGIYQVFAQTVIIDDARFPREIKYFKDKDSLSVKTINIKRPNYKNHLSEKCREHISEVGLDNYKNYDYTIINDGTLDDLKDKVRELLEGMN